jgi:hypothetical protein
MPERCALVVDSDQDFSSLAERSFVSSGLKLRA